MRKVVIITGSIGVSVIVAGGVAAWLMTRPAPEQVNTQGGTVALDTGDEDKSRSSGLAVDQSNGGMQGLPLGGQPAADRGKDSAAGPGRPGPVPTTKEFADYLKHKDSQQVHFIDYSPGTGPEAKATDKLVVNYTAWLSDGRQFDDTYTKGQPFVFMPSEQKVIPGVGAGVVGMKVGGRRRLIVPPSGAYGAQGKDPIPPNALLVFDLELVAAQKE